MIKEYQRITKKKKIACVNTKRVPPGHPIILPKSNKFNIAAVSVKRSIRLDLL